MALFVAGTSTAAWAAAAARKGRAAGAAQTQTKRCVAAYDAAREQEQAGHLRHAKELYAACAHETCSLYLEQECSTHFNQLDGDIPTVIPMVTDKSGTPLPVEVKLDGKLLTAKPDGRAVEVDPGLHEFTFTSDAGVVTTKSIMVLQGQRNRLLLVKVPGQGAGKASPAVAGTDAPNPPAKPAALPAPASPAAAAGAAPPPEETAAVEPAQIDTPPGDHASPPKRVAVRAAKGKRTTGKRLAAQAKPGRSKRTPKRLRSRAARAAQDNPKAGA